MIFHHLIPANNGDFLHLFPVDPGYLHDLFPLDSGDFLHLFPVEPGYLHDLFPLDSGDFLHLFPVDRDFFHLFLQIRTLCYPVFFSLYIQKATVPIIFSCR